MQEEITGGGTPGPITIIGAGLAGSEAAFQLARRGVPVRLLEMRPIQSTPVHHTDLPGELVCSNSLGSITPGSAPGQLKNEMSLLGSLVMEAAAAARVPAGQALAVDREKFSLHILDRLQSFKNLEIVREEACCIPTEGTVIIATGPLTSPALAASLARMMGREHLFFFDAVSPIVMAESLDMSRVFAASRYGRGTPDYLNCPMTGEQYAAFYHELVNAEKADPEGFEEGHFFQGCMPVEELARMGEKTLLFGPLKPVGLDDNAQAVVQLRRENREGTMYSLVGFQTRLRWGEQKRVFRMIPGMEKAEFARYGVMHRNIYVDSPRVLALTLQMKSNPCIFLAGQITGVEGYTESAAMGLAAGMFAAARHHGTPVEPFPRETAIGSLIHYLTDEEVRDFQPMNINFGILPPSAGRGSKKDRRLKVIAGAEEALKAWSVRWPVFSG
jgi:methylenetetrahydrofolate--tRNA-(uracil-5-)-methyltransferase